MTEITRPFDLLNSIMNEQVLVRLKGTRQLRGKLRAFDQHMNLVLDEAEELEDDQLKSKLGKVIVRGDNILYVSP
ncbi:MAG: LSM domain-containing protein [Candidatus Micrarchaeota archaeon]